MAGRIMARRFMGKLAFMSLVDDSGSIQIYLDKAVIDGTSGEDTFKWVLRPLQAYPAQRLSCILVGFPLRAHNYNFWTLAELQSLAPPLLLQKFCCSTSMHAGI